jgi:GH15 family glucan-1,4-alpha-glucosidase
VRGKKQDFVYSKIMMWVAIDRAIRLADKRCFPCPHRWDWYRVRDEICEEVMEKGYNSELGSFIQSYEANDVLDSSILIAPLVFFISPSDPRFLKTLDRILQPPEKGGLTSTGLVYRYNSAKSDDGQYMSPLRAMMIVSTPQLTLRHAQRSSRYLASRHIFCILSPLIHLADYN